MRKLDFLLIAVPFTLIAQSAIAQGNNAEICELNGTTQHENNECARARFAKVEAEMNRLYGVQMAYLSYEPRKGLLRASQRTWLEYRDKSCLYEYGPQEETGIIWPMQNFLCRAKLTEQRNEILKTYVECRYNGCPG